MVKQWTKKEKGIILTIAYITVLFDSMNNSLLNPVLPYLVKELNATTFQEGIFFSVYSAMQLISLLIMGPMSDKFGRKLFIILSLIGSCVGCLCQGLSKDMWSLIFWRGITGLFAGSFILVQAIIADIMSTEERSKWLARLDAVISAAYIVGQGIGGILGTQSCQLPLFVASGFAGAALIVTVFFLKETNPKLLNKEEMTSTSTEQTNKQLSEQPKHNLHITCLMICCFIYEFCVRFSQGGYNSRYGIYVTNKFEINSVTFSAILVTQSILSCIIQSIVYPWLIYTLNISIPIIAIIGMICMSLGIALVTLPTLWLMILASTILSIGYCLSSPTSVSILSTSTHPDFQGRILSYNNFFYQIAMIVSPIALSAVYKVNKELCFYVSALISSISLIVIIYVATWKNAKDIGKKALYKDEEKEVELHEIAVEEKEKSVENTVEEKNTVEVSGNNMDIVNTTKTTEINTNQISTENTSKQQSLPSYMSSSEVITPSQDTLM